MSPNPLADDLEGVLERTLGLWEELRGRRVFITGGTGFVGSWLLESFLWSNEKLKLAARAVVLSRDPAAFARKAPHLAADVSLEWLMGDVRTFEFPKGEFSHAIHAATDAGAEAAGTRHVLDFAVASGAKKFLFTSSGAAAGTQPSAYAAGKRFAEHLCKLAYEQHGIEAKIARCFAFVGPYLPLDAHYAIGNFIRDGLDGGPIRVKGDGTPVRSYLYAADLAAWLWTILFKGDRRPYDVGSPEAVTILQTAQAVADAFRPKPEIRIEKKPGAGMGGGRYVPNVERAQSELGLSQTVGLTEAIQRTIQWQSKSATASRNF